MPTQVRCIECGWRGDESEAIIAGDKVQCPKCKTVLVTGPEEPAELFDVQGAENLAHQHGDRFLGYYHFQNKLGLSKIPLGVHDLSYEFTLVKHTVRFVIPSNIEFNNGIISYADPERQLGMFRYPRDRQGNFCTPLNISKEIQDAVISLTPEAMEKLLNAPRPLLFEAFRIPFHRFEFYDLTEQNLQEIERLTDADFMQSVKQRHAEVVDATFKDILSKIEASPNYLLILQKVLNREMTDFDAVSKATNNIIHIA